MTQEKRVIYSYAELQTFSQQQNLLRYLSAAQLSFLLTSIPPASWSTRWTDDWSIYRDDIDAFVAEVVCSLSTNVDFCQLVADCIRTDARVLNALKEVVPPLITDEGGNGSRAGAGSRHNVVQCEDDKLYGGIIAAIQYTDRIIVDILEKLAAGTNIFERVALLFEGTPILGLLPIDDAINAVSIFADTTLEQYQAAWTLQAETDLACEIYCLIDDNEDCKFNSEIMTDALWSLAQLTPLATLELAWEAIAQGTYTGARLAYVFFLTTLLPAKFEDFIFGTNSSATSLIAAFENGAANASDSGWNTCACPQTWTSIIEDPKLFNLFVPYVGRAIWTGSAWQSGSLATVVQINSITFTSAFISTVEIDATVSGTYQFWPAAIGSVPGQSSTVSSVFTVDATCTQIAVGVDSTPDAYSGEIVRVIVSGTGTKPPELP